MSPGFDLKLEKSTPDSVSGIIIHQPENGYRHSIDPLLLAAHVCVQPAAHIIDIGCGCGIISLILACRFPTVQITGIETQTELAAYARQNVLDNRFEHQVCIINKDINLLPDQEFHTPADIIVSNPPYRKKGTGRINPNGQKAIARHEITLNLNQMFTAAHRFLTQSGRLYMIYPLHRLPDVIKTAQLFCMEFDFIRPVHPKPGTAAIRVIVCIQKEKNGSGRILDPFYLYSPGNNPTQEYLSLFKP